MFCINRRIRLKVIQSAAGAPSPGAQRSPIFRFAWLALVDEPNDAARDTRTIVCLNARGIEQHEAPTGCYQLPSVRKITIFIPLRKLERRRLSQLPSGMLLEYL